MNSKYKWFLTALFLKKCALNIDSYEDDGCYFMSQEDEGKYEMEAVLKMYDGLKNFDEIDKDISIVSALGIGNGSCQYTMLKNKRMKTLCHTGGMMDINELMKMPDTFLKDIDISVFNDVDKPLIALKSGCLLHYCKN